MTKTSPRLAQRKSPHITAENFRAEQRPTLIEYEEEFLAYDGEGAYRLIKDRTIDSEVQTYLEGAQEMRPTGTAGAMKGYPFNPKTADVIQVSETLGRKYHVPPGSIAPPFFLPGPIDYSAIAPANVIACRNGLLDISTRTLYDPSSQFFTRSALPIAFDPDAWPDRWLTFLDEVLSGDAELILLMQQWFGYLITCDTSFQKILYPWLEIKCSRCQTPRDVDLCALPHVPTTCVHDLAGRLVCQKCKRVAKGPAATLLQLTPRSRNRPPANEAA